jgi:hypothetical protein
MFLPKEFACMSISTAARILESSVAFEMCWVHVTRSLVLCVCLVDRCLPSFLWSLCFCPSSIYRFWLPLWYLQAILPIPFLFSIKNHNQLFVSVKCLCPFSIDNCIVRLTVSEFNLIFQISLNTVVLNQKFKKKRFCESISSSYSASCTRHEPLVKYHV